jgi:hypothetical protein
LYTSLTGGFLRAFVNTVCCIQTKALALVHGLFLQWNAPHVRWHTVAFTDQRNHS